MFATRKAFFGSLTQRSAPVACSVASGRLSATMRAAVSRSGGRLAVNRSTRGYITSRVYDVAINDIADADYRALGQSLGVQRLSATPKPTSQFPIEGVIHGANSRIFVPLVVSNGNVHKNVWFLLVTGSPVTFLTAETMGALGICAASVDSVQVSIQSTPTLVTRSSPSFANVDLLGQDWLTKVAAKLQVDYKKGTVMIEKSEARALRNEHARYELM